MIYGLIICAGKQSRFKSDIPKALVEFNGKSLLDVNISNMSPFCDEIHVVCSYENEHFFTCKNKIVISSGKGSGDAVWQALEHLNVKDGDSCYIMWGDSLQKAALFEQLKLKYNGETIIPCRFEENPYVQVIQKEENKLEIRFSKFKETITAGYHDLSLFYCNALELLSKLREFRSKILDDNGNYVHKHGNEMEFLDVFNETDLPATILDVKNYDDFAFNTIEQFNELKNKMSIE